MVVIKRKKGESKERMFREFTREFINEDIVGQIRERLFYKKPSQVEKERKIERSKRKRR